MPYAAKKPCSKQGCPKLTDNRYCEDHRQTSDLYRSSSNSRGYDAAWRRVRLLALNRDKWICVTCYAAGRVTPALDVDHIVPVIVAPERRLDLDNLQSLCRPHHRLKTAADQRK